MFFGYIDMEVISSSGSRTFRSNPMLVLDRDIAAATEGLVDDRLQLGDQVVGRRLEVVQLVDLAEQLVLAQTEAVIGQQLDSRSRSCAGV